MSVNGPAMSMPVQWNGGLAGLSHSLLTHHLVLSGGCDRLAHHTVTAYGTDGPNNMKDSTYRPCKECG